MGIEYFEQCNSYVQHGNARLARRGLQTSICRMTSELSQDLQANFLLHLARHAAAIKTIPEYNRHRSVVFTASLESAKAFLQDGHSCIPSMNASSLL